MCGGGRDADECDAHSNLIEENGRAIAMKRFAFLLFCLLSLQTVNNPTSGISYTQRNTRIAHEQKMKSSDATL